MIIISSCSEHIFTQVNPFGGVRWEGGRPVYSTSPQIQVNHQDLNNLFQNNQQQQQQCEMQQQIMMQQQQQFLQQQQQQMLLQQQQQQQSQPQERME